MVIGAVLSESAEEIGRKIEQVLRDLAEHRDEPDRLLTVRHAAEILDVSRDHVRGLIARGDLVAHNIAPNPAGRPMYRIRHADLIAYIRRVTDE